jgi:hypothetical protein
VCMSMFCVVVWTESKGVGRRMGPKQRKASKKVKILQIYRQIRQYGDFDFF